jgi:type I restriction enzyme S subunit
MTHALKPYLAYQESGVPWLGNIPAHWETERAKWLFQKMKRPVRPDDDVVTCFRDGTVTLRKNRRVRGFTNALKEIGYQGVRRGDLVIHAMDAFAGAAGVSDSDGKCTPVYAVCQTQSDSSPYYYAHVVREMARSQWIAALAKGVRERSTDFRFEGFAAQVVPVPPRDEQDRIAAFLDHIDRRTRRYIRAKRKLIALLEEQKQAIIQRAVTRGLEPNVRLKPSGMKWLGEVPEHWEIKRAKYYLREVNERSATGEEELLSVSHITGVTPRSQKNITMFMASSYVGHKLCHPGDLAVNTMWVWMGALGIVNQTGIVSPSYSVYRLLTSDAFVADFLDNLLRTKPYISEYVLRSTGIRSSRLRVYPEEFLKIRLVRPPYEEQVRIVEAIGRQAQHVDRAVAQTQREIDLIREFRTRLIADVVTGKLNVRQAAANLPEEGEEPEDWDEDQAEAESDGDLDEADAEADDGE